MNVPGAALAVPGTASTVSGAPVQIPGRYIVTYDSDAARARSGDVLRAAGLARVATVGAIGSDVVSATAATADALRLVAGVASVEPDARVAPSEVIPNDLWWRDSISLLTVRAAAAWASTRGSSSVVVAVLDSGVDYAQPDMQGAFVGGYDFINGDSDPADDNGHGSGAAGVVGARSDNGVGVTGYCSRCSIMPVKIAGADGYATWSAMASGITWAADHGARVISLSFAATSGSTSVANAISYAQSRGAVVVDVEAHAEHALVQMGAGDVLRRSEHAVRR